MERILIDGLSFAIPLFVMAIGGIYSEKSGVTNLALEGLQGMGAFRLFWKQFPGSLLSRNCMCHGRWNAVFALIWTVMYPSEGKSDHWRSRDQYPGYVTDCIFYKTFKPPCVRCSFGKICSGCVCTVYNSAALRHPSNWSRI